MCVQEVFFVDVRTSLEAFSVPQPSAIWVREKGNVLTSPGQH